MRTHRLEPFAVAKFNNHLELDSNRYMRMLGRRGFRSEERERRIVGWQRAGTWPPPQSFFETDAATRGRDADDPLGCRLLEQWTWPVC